MVAMTVNRHKYFRWTPRTARLTFIYVVLVPGIMGYTGYQLEVSCTSGDKGGRLMGVGQMANAREAEGRFDLGVLEERR